MLIFNLFSVEWIWMDGWMAVVVDRSNQFRINVQLFIKRDRKKARLARCEMLINAKNDFFLYKMVSAMQVALASCVVYAFGTTQFRSHTLLQWPSVQV